MQKPVPQITEIQYSQEGKRARHSCCLSHVFLEDTGHIFAQEMAKIGQMSLHISGVKIRF